MGRVAASVVATLLAGCSFDPSGTSPGQPDSSAACEWQAANLDPCALGDPVGRLTLDVPGDYVYDTSAGVLTAPGGADVPHASELVSTSSPVVRVLIVDDFTLQVESELLALGDHPLVILSWNEIDVRGILDVGSELGVSSSPAGRDPADCADNAAEPGVDDTSGSSGGGGGGFQGAGGDGGDGDLNMGASEGGRGGGMISAPLSPRGGCSGARGGDIDVPRAGGEGGAGGGAIQLSAQNRIRVRDNGQIDARGAGGGHGLASDGGGGGGGSGGWIGLDAPVIDIAADTEVAANGGGGGSGASDVEGIDGANGQLSDQPAGGGGNASNATAGGDGGAGASVDGLDVPGLETGGGGGGGGGAGYVIVWGDLRTAGAAVVSPVPTDVSP